MTTTDRLLELGGELIHDGTCIELPDNATVKRALLDHQLDDRYPFSLEELCYRNGRKAPGRLFVPQGAALAAKLDVLVHVVGPWRLRRGVAFDVLGGGGYDPITDAAGKRVTHRSSSSSHHQYVPAHPRFPRRGGGTAVDIRARGDVQPNEADIEWLKGVALDDGRRVSVIVYYPGRGGAAGFIHVDLRTGAPYRARER